MNIIIFGAQLLFSSYRFWYLPNLQNSHDIRCIIELSRFFFSGMNYVIISDYNDTEAVRQLIFPKLFLSLWKSVCKIL